MISVFHNLSIYLFIFVSNRRCRHCWCCLCCLCCCCCFSPFSIHLFNKNKYNIRRHCCAAIYIALHPFQNFAQIVDGSIGYFLAYERCCLALTHSPTKSFAFFYYFQFASFIHLVDVCLCERSTIFILQSENCQQNRQYSRLLICTRNRLHISFGRVICVSKHNECDIILTILIRNEKKNNNEKR